MSDSADIVMDMTKDVAIKAVSATTDVMEKMTRDLLNMLIKKRQEELEQAKLKGEIDKGGEMAFERMKYAVEKTGDTFGQFLVGEEQLDLFLNTMNEEKATYAVLDLANEEGKVVLYLQSENDKIDNVINILNVKSGLINEIHPQLFVRSISEEDVAILEDIGDVDLELFRNYVDDSVIFSVLKDEKNNKVDLLFNKKDKEAVQEAMAKAQWDLTDKFHGEKVREHIEYKLKGRSQMNMDLRDAEKEFYVVSGKDPSTYIFVSHDDFTYYKNNHLMKSTERTDSMIDELSNQVRSIPYPVMMSVDEFGLPLEEKEKIIQKTMDPFPKDYDNIISQNTRNHMRSLVLRGADDEQNVELNEKMFNRQRKIALDNEVDSPAYIEDDSFTYSDFSVYEHQEDIAMNEAELDAREEEFKHYIESNKALHRYEVIEVKLEDRSVDYLIHNAEQIQEQKIADEKQRNRNLYKQFKQDKQER